MNRNETIINAAVARALILAMGMQAENLQREHRGESMAYVEIDFKRLIDQEGIGANGVVLFLRGDGY